MVPGCPSGSASAIAFACESNAAQRGSAVAAAGLASVAAAVVGVGRKRCLLAGHVLPADGKLFKNTFDVSKIKFSTKFLNEDLQVLNYYNIAKIKHN